MRACIAVKTSVRSVLTLLSTNASATLNAMASPSRVLVPRPSSSIIALSHVALDGGVYTTAETCASGEGTNMPPFSMFFRINAVSRISEAKVDILASMLSSVVTRAKS